MTKPRHPVTPESQNVNVLLVFAHPEPKSFGQALVDRACRTLSEAGHEVVVSDLYGMNFNPVASPRDFEARRFPDALQYDREQKHSSEHGGFSPDIQQELDKLLKCDMLILQFPLWWWSVPAIMKGWIDRVFVNGQVYGSGRRLDSGGMKGKRAMLSITTGCYPEMVAPDGMLGDLEISLWHLHAGTLRYAGFDVLPPFTAWSIHYTDERKRAGYLDAYAERLRTLQSSTPMFFHPQADFENWRLRQGLESRSIGIRRVAGS